MSEKYHIPVKMGLDLHGVPHHADGADLALDRRLAGRVPLAAPQTLLLVVALQVGGYLERIHDLGS